jgi:flagellar protein FlgJ
MGEGLGDSEETRFYQDMFDQQLAVQLSKGDGIGLATRLVEQLARSGLTPPAAPAVGDAPAAAPQARVESSGDRNTNANSDAARAEFIARLRPHAERAAQQLGVATEAVIAQAALETGWGRHLPAAGEGAGFNLFGIKANAAWGGARVSAVTTEFQQGAMQSLPQSFRGYGSLAEGVQDYSKLISGSARYAAALNSGDDVQAFATALKQGGYATDPDYVQKLVDTAASVRRLMHDASLKSAAQPPITAGNGTA